ncbi:DUF3703 domain-containing protein [Embleya sp. NPDC001921]
MPEMLRGVHAASAAESAAARAAGPGTRGRAYPERARVLSRPWVRTHVRAHGAMLARAVRPRDPREVAGEFVRRAVGRVARGSGTGRYPVGDTGRANVPMSAPTPPDLAALPAAAVGPARIRPR